MKLSTTFQFSFEVLTSILPSFPIIYGIFLAKCLYQRLIDLSGNDGSILVPDNIHAESCITVLFQKLAEEMYTTFKGTLKCGNLESKIILSPGPVVSLLAYSDYPVFLCYILL